MPRASRIVGAACPRPSCPSGIAKEISDCELECTACGARFGVKPGTTTEYRNRYADMPARHPSGIANMNDLWEVARHSPLVAMHLRIWEQGGFPSLEAALISLAVHQGRAALAMAESMRARTDASPPALKLSMREIADVERILKRRWPNARSRCGPAPRSSCIADHDAIQLVLLEPESAREPFNVFANMCPHEDCRRVYFAVCEKPPSPGGDASAGKFAAAADIEAATPITAGRPGRCTCGEPNRTNVVHREQGPCYQFERGGVTTIPDNIADVVAIKDPYGDAYGARPEDVVTGETVIMPEL